MKPEILAALQKARADKRPVALVTNLKSGAQKLIYETEAEGPLCLDVDMLAGAADMLKRDESGTIQTGAGPIFVHAFNPPPRVIVVGAVHIAEPLVRIASLAGYGVTLVDPRRAFAASQKFEDYTVSNDWPDEAMAKLKPDVRTAIVTLTHDPKIDDPALEAALKSTAFYIGALGSRKTHAARLERLKARGFTDNEISRIRGPVGLAIGALSPAEIAVSIVAEITKIRRGE
ncbi:MAG: XdhC family protein [Rhodospirillales bacterium]|nr:XdhC family protein [Rhodospirillales bacterium]